MTDLIDVPTAAELTGYSVDTIRRKVRTGVLPAVRRGRAYFFTRDALAELYKPVATG